MFIKFNRSAVLVTGMALLYSSLSLAQAPIVDVSEDRFATSDVNDSGELTRDAGNVTPSSGGQGEMYNQLLLLQQEVMQLRGIVESQTNTINQLKAQSMERYIDLDRRLGELSGGVGPADNSANSQSMATRTAAAQADEKPRYNAAYNLVIGKRFNDALDAFKQFLVDFPDGKYAPNSLYWLGELYQVVNPQDLEASRQAFTQLLTQYPGHAKSSDAMYKLGKVYYQKGNPTKSRQWMERVIADYGNGANTAADKARQFLKTKF